MVPFAGYLMPVQYTGVNDEHHDGAERRGMFDVSHMGEFIVRGPQALELIQKVDQQRCSKVEPGKVQYSCMPNGKGGIVDDLLVYHMKHGDDEHYVLVVNASNLHKDWDWIQKNNTFDAQVGEHQRPHVLAGCARAQGNRYAQRASSRRISVPCRTTRPCMQK